MLVQPDLLARVASYLSDEDLARCCQVCRGWSALALRSDASLWRRMARSAALPLKLRGALWRDFTASASIATAGAPLVWTTNESVALGVTSEADRRTRAALLARIGAWLGYRDAVAATHPAFAAKYGRAAKRLPRQPSTTATNSAGGGATASSAPGTARSQPAADASSSATPTPSGSSAAPAAAALPVHGRHTSVAKVYSALESDGETDEDDTEEEGISEEVEGGADAAAESGAPPSPLCCLTFVDLILFADVDIPPAQRSFTRGELLELWRPKRRLRGRTLLKLYSLFGSYTSASVAAAAAASAAAAPTTPAAAPAPSAAAAAAAAAGTSTAPILGGSTAIPTAPHRARAAIDHSLRMTRFPRPQPVHLGPVTAQEAACPMAPKESPLKAATAHHAGPRVPSSTAVYQAFLEAGRATQRAAEAVAACKEAAAKV
jgi:hypothetical protein